MGNTSSIRGITDNGRYIVVSADTHGGARMADYRPYLPATLHDDFDAWAAEYLPEGDQTNPNNYDHDQRRTEQGVSWIKSDLPMLGWFAKQVRLKHDAADHLERTPRQTFRDQVRFGASFPGAGEIA